MLYEPFGDLRLSRLGLGAMRLPTIGVRGPIDEEKARALIEYAYEHGVNYFDTGYGYHGGASERFVGKVLSQYPRDTWNLASKMPGHMMSYKNGKLGFMGYMVGSTVASPMEIFEDQLQKCGVDYFDVYLLHNVCETAREFYTDEELKVVDYLIAQRDAGRIRHLGFSAHGRAEIIDEFLTWRDCFEFVQLQLNYLDWSLQDARRKYEVVTKHGVPVISMEPCRGGSLASLSDEANAMLKKARPNDSIASWAFRFLQSLPNVKVVLSGMTTMEQLLENIALFSRDDPTTEDESALLRQAVASMVDMIPCTACRYCCDACPQGLDIPKLLSMYNEISYGAPSTLMFTLGAMGQAELPAACRRCGACKALCPQGIDIPEVMRKFAEARA